MNTLLRPLDLRSKFLHYHPHIAIISGIAWDHINVFPTFDEYLETFRKFILSIQANGYLIYNAEDEELVRMVNELKPTINLIPYKPFAFKSVDDESILLYDEKEFSINVFGSHNFANLKSAFEVGKIIGLSETQILESFQSFQGAAKRLEKIHDDKAKQLTVFRDFAHAPSKVKATVKAVRERYANRKIIAVFELHTYSSLQENFIEHYAYSLDAADVRILFLDEEALKIKNKQDLDESWLKEQFADESILVFKDAAQLKEKINLETTENCVILLMSSGNFAGMSLM
jgi:UDP-N-acetylmuramate: L-alanyl-gamma-D-glutamyl-meso-diaminopimelate ligase